MENSQRTFLVFGRAYERHTFLAHVFTVLGLVSILAFAPLYIFVYQEPIKGWIEIGCGIFLLLNLLLLRSPSWRLLGCHILTFLIFSLFIFLLLTGGIQGTGIFWFYIFPVSVFALMGLWRGMVWNVLFFGVILGLLLLNSLDIIFIPYSFSLFRHFFFTLLIVSVISFVNEWSIHRQIS